MVETRSGAKRRMGASRRSRTPNRSDTAAENIASTSRRRRQSFKKGATDKDAAKENVRKRASTSRRSSRESKHKAARGLSVNAANKSSVLVLGCGSNENGQLGTNPKTAEAHSPVEIDLIPGSVKSIVAGYGRTFLLTEKGEVYSCGDNSHNALCRNTSSKEDTQEKEDEEMKEGTQAEEEEEMYTEARRKKEEEEMTAEARLAPINETDCIDVSTGGSHTLILKSNGQVRIAGAFRNNDELVHEYPGTTQVVPFEGLLLDERVVEVWSGRDYCVALTSAGRIFTMGLVGPWLSREWFSGAKVDLVFRPILLPAGQGDLPVKISCGETSLYILTQAGNVWSCGQNKYGELGVGDCNPRACLTLVNSPSGKFITDVAAGSFHGLFLLADGPVYACGRGDSGELGIREESQVEAAFKAVTPTQVILPPGIKPTMIAAGDSFSIIVTESMIFTCGMGEYGRLGHCNEDYVYVPRHIDFIAARLHVTSISSIAAGDMHSFIVVDGKRIADPPQGAIIERSDGDEMVHEEAPVKKYPGSEITLGALFSQRNAEGSWSCAVCYLRNGAAENKCVACETARDDGHVVPVANATAPSESSAGGAISSGGIIFGSAAAAPPVASASSSSAGGFTFNATDGVVNPFSIGTS